MTEGVQRRPHHMKRLLLIGCVALLAAAVQAGKGDPPRLDETVQTRFRVPIATKQFKLVCPVHPEEKDKTMVQWSRNGEPIDWEHQYKIAKDNRELRMKNVKEDDSGRFKCTAVNGFGHQSIEFIVQVFDPETDVLTVRDRISLSNHTSAPEWIDDALMLNTANTPIRVNLGGKVELRCPARGNPLPVIRWFKNEKLLPHDGPMDSALYVVESAKTSESAEYRCEVVNKFGTQQATFKVLVADFFDANAEELQGFAEDGLAPVIEQTNISVAVGHTAQFLCKARISHKPIIKWLKQISDPSRAGKNATYVHANGMHLVLVEQNSQHLTSDESSDGEENFVTNRLIVPQVTMDSEGKYICVVTTNPAGHIVYRSAYLSVEKGLMIGSINLSENTFWLIAAPVAFIFIVLVICAVCYLKSSSLAGDANGNMKTAQHPPPPRIPPPPAPQDVVYPQISQVQQVHYTLEKPRSPMILRDSMFQPPRHATLDRMHTPHRLHRGIREEDLQHSYAGSSPMYWTQNGVGHHLIGPPPPTVISMASGATSNYRTLDMPYGRDPDMPYGRADPHPSVYSYDYAEHMPFLTQPRTREI